MVSEPGTRKNDSIDSAKDAAPCHSGRKENTKKIERKKKSLITRLKKKMKTKTENCSTDDKSGEDQSTNSEDDMDSGATFEEDSEKEIDTAEIEEEDWFDYIRRSTAEAVDKMDQTKIRCWNKTHKKMKWKTSPENCNITE